MDGTRIALVALVAAVTVYVGHQAYESYSGRTYRRHIMKATDPSDLETELRQHSETFERKVINVTKNIHLAIGYALANSIMIDAPKGLIIVDTTETVGSGQEIFAEFRKISKKPVKAIIYTHQHADHTWGAKAFIEDPENPPDIWAYHTTAKAMTLFLTTGNTARMIRSYRMFGAGLDNTSHVPINDGIGPHIELKTSGGHTVGPVYPNRVLHGSQEDTKIAGLDVTLYHIPGETDDQIGIWIPRDKAFVCGDDVYKAFPNIYTIRGAPARDAVDWYTSIDLMIDLEPEHLVPSHTLPISGKQRVLDAIIPYRDGIQYVHDQTIRWMNKGMTPDDIAHTVNLPDNLRLHPYLREYYGTVFWSAKGIFAKYLGWFSGDPVDLHPLHSVEKAHLMVKLAGGIRSIIRESHKALKDKQFQWALELSTHALKVDSTNEEARNVKMEALTSLAAHHLSPNARNYYNTAALEESGEITVQTTDTVNADVVQFLPVEDIFVVLRMKYTPEKCGDRSTVVVFEFLDEKKIISIQLRNGVAVVKHRLLPFHDIKVTTTLYVWKQLLVQNVNNIETFKDIDIEGDIITFIRFMDCFTG